MKTEALQFGSVRTAHFMDIWRQATHVMTTRLDIWNTANINFSFFLFDV